MGGSQLQLQLAQVRHRVEGTGLQQRDKSWVIRETPYYVGHSLRFSRFHGLLQGGRANM